MLTEKMTPLEGQTLMKNCSLKETSFCSKLRVKLISINLVRTHQYISIENRGEKYSELYKVTKGLLESQATFFEFIGIFGGNPFSAWKNFDFTRDD